MKRTERQGALNLAERILDRPNADPDDDLAMLSRQLLRGQEIIDRMHKQLQEVDWDGKAELDLIHSNRDQMFKVAEEALQRVRKCLEAADVTKALKVLDAARMFHPMSDDLWCGWPE